ncbi:MAG TPA: 3-phosphoshikimate 1-carboxyvinyltransferase [Flavobacterium sp.]
MNIRLEPSLLFGEKTIRVPGSKSETNRLLLLRALYPELQIENMSDSDDSDAMRTALIGNDHIDVGHAGTAMRFLTAFFAIQRGRTVTITGSARMKQRPIKILVDALRTLGAEITYLEDEGYPPLRIVGRDLISDQVSLAADVSSQYISALLLIAPKLPNGLKILLTGIVTSRPYINMTLSLLKQIGAECSFEDREISVSPLHNVNRETVIIVESDWSAASYFYSIVALSPVGSSLRLQNFRSESFQGDIKIIKIYKLFGVQSSFDNGVLQIRKKGVQLTKIELDCNDTPDIAQTIVVTCFGLGISCHLTGLHTLVIKETDRLHALKTEITKLGGKAEITYNSIYLYPASHCNQEVVINSYDDHRMAMAFATLGVKVAINIADAEVVSKSYPAFWQDIAQLGLLKPESLTDTIQS